MRPKLIRRRRRFPRNRICLSDTPRSRLFIGPRLHSSSNHPREINVDERTRELQLDPRKVYLKGRRGSMIIRGQKPGALAECRLSRALAHLRSGCAPDALGDARLSPAYLPPGKAVSPRYFFLRMLPSRAVLFSLSLSRSFVRSCLRVPRRFSAEKLLKSCAIALCATALLRLLLLSFASSSVLPVFWNSLLVIFNNIYSKLC